MSLIEKLKDTSLSALEWFPIYGLLQADINEKKGRKTAFNSKHTEIYGCYQIVSLCGLGCGTIHGLYSLVEKLM